MRLPLTFGEIVNEITRFSGLSKAEVEHRVWMQALEPGWNVLRDVARFGVTPHVYDERMLQLYREGDGFIFETLVFWSKPSRQRWTQHAIERIRLYAARSGMESGDIAILILGDGAGNDSLYLAHNAFKIDYYDVPGSKTFDFAIKRFDAYALPGHSVRPINDYGSCFAKEYDVVISFEVLEHLPQPLQTIRDIQALLKTGGIALVTEDFGDITNRLPTHLKANSRYSGKTAFLFLRNSMALSWYSREEIFKPFEFVKVKSVSTNDWLALFQDRDIRGSYLSKFSRPLMRIIGKLPYVGG